MREEEESEGTKERVRRCASALKPSESALMDMWRAVRAYLGRFGFLFEGIPSQGFRVFVVCYVTFLVLTLVALAEEGHVNPVDQTISNWVHAHPSMRADWVESITKLGGNGIVKKGCWLSVIALLLLRKWEYVPPLLIGVFGAMDMNGFLKEMIARPRAAFPDISEFTGFAFPSGHMTAAVALYGFWAIFFIVEVRSKALRFVLVAPLLGAIVAVGLTRIMLLAHWTTDVISACALTVFWILAWVWINRCCWRSR